MKILNPIKLLLVLTMLAVGFSSCEEDDETIYDYLIGRTWVGDLGFIDGPYALESGITFKGNDYAVDRQFYYAEDGGGEAGTLRLNWWIDMGTLYLDYGPDYPLLEIRGVYITGRFLYGELYADGNYEFSVTLEAN
ncbi:hypothetical protein K8P02_06460 [Bacteroides nordii]|uniref:hypothetical protein n=1 Tax=Bacteroides nordii TaxID=291645 RepID=UPI00189C05D1|nr:hypothetical protein [Bacteroides nordii]MBD9110185.1 hypothetical protein [Bacteroides nordii]UAK43924.1 hypothetical protein K8P02_06460 [Bacteroides nordii]